MTENQQARQKLQDELRKLFQFDVSDLDFGIYRILNRKKDRIEQFIEKDLLDAVKEGLKEYQQQDASQVDEIKQQIIENLSEDAFDDQGNLVKYENTKLGKDYLDALEKAEKQEVGADTEKKIYNDLFTFFSRYYDNGDFLSKRRISTRDSKYAVPYNGEEVLLHWANKDQYYIKTGEQFTSFKFELEGGKKSVWFKVAQAETDKDNVKEEEDRSFVLRPENPIEVEGDELTLWFEYRPITDAEEERWLNLYKKVEKPRKTVDRSVLCVAYNEFVLNVVDKEWRDLLSVIPKNKDRSLLYQKLNHYTGKNTTDYFIHKDLKSFLERELEYYLKNEVIRVDDFIEDQSQQAMEVALIRARVVQQIGQKIIAFLSQIENFQRKLFEKRKFVVDTHYCFTLDMVPENLHDTILENKDQLQSWEELYVMGKWKGELEWNGEWTKEFLKDHPFIMLDTQFFDEDFKYSLLNSYNHLDDILNGLNINGDNYHGLNLLRKKFEKKVECVHIDPPYNTNTSGFLYKNSYKHSSWLSMMQDRLKISLTFLTSTGSFQCHIDENEQSALHNLLDTTTTVDLGTIVWDKKNPMLGKKGIATQHEYILWRALEEEVVYMRNKNILKILDVAQQIIDKHGGVNDKSRKEFRSWLNEQEYLSGGEKAYNHIDENGRIFQSVGMGAPEPRTNPKYHKPLIHPGTGKECPVPPNGWSRSPATLQQLVDNDEIVFGDDENKQPRKKVFLTADSKRQLSSRIDVANIIEEAKSGKSSLQPLGLEFPYSHPVELYEELIYAGDTTNHGYVLDYFAGSGTTGHAVQKLNVEDGGGRKYIQIEMGKHFNSTLLKRIKKIVFSNSWKDGIPQDKDGQSHCFKYHFIESYEDALNNINFKNPEDTQQAMQFEDYLLHYMLNFETQGVSATLLNEDAFDTPFDYQLNIQRGHDSLKPEIVDMVETFHYLIGLWVQTLRRYEHQNRKYVVSKGQIRDEDAVEDVCIIWRNTNDLDLEKEATWIQETILQDQTFDRIYINGVNKVKNAEPIELTFREKMFEDVA